jgi:hypothetical protein
MKFSWLEKIIKSVNLMLWLLVTDAGPGDAGEGRLVLTVDDSTYCSRWRRNFS